MTGRINSVPHLVALFLFLFPVPARAVVTGNTGLNLNNFTGADTFYANGFTGSRSVVTVIDAGHVWGGHESLAHVTRFIDDPGSVAPNGDVDRHATWVAGALAGRPTAVSPTQRQIGIAHGAELWSGALASTWNGTPYTLSFSWTGRSFRHPYYTALVGGVDGRTTDVVNSSFGTISVRDNSLSNARVIDALINQSGKTVVFVAGNNGSTADPTPGAFASTFNTIVVGGLTSDTTSPPYDARTPASAYGPNSFWNPATLAIVPLAIPSVDIAAAGTNITLPFYGGTTGGNTGGTLQTGSNLYSQNTTGTSFAAPQVAGGAALIIDAGKALFGGGPAIDGRVVKSVLLNSATKTPGWDNQQFMFGSILSTARSLDYHVGAGRLNLARAYTQYTGGTTDVPGLGAGGTPVEPIGWDFAQVAQNAPTDYRLAEPLRAGTTLTVTLNWFVDNAYNAATDTVIDQSLDNLDLEVWRVTRDQSVPDVLVARAVGSYNNVEHLAFALPGTAQYMLRVRWTSEVFDTVNDPNQELFGLAWSGTAALLGDADHSGVVDHDDFLRLWNHFGKAGTFEDGDFSLNGLVDFPDFQILERNFGLTTSGARDPSVGPAPSIPEPAHAAVFLLVLVCLQRGAKPRFPDLIR